MAILKQIKFGGNTYDIVKTQVEIAESTNSLKIESANTDNTVNDDPIYTIGLAVDGKTILDEKDGLKSGLTLAFAGPIAAGTEPDVEAKEARIVLQDKDGKELSAVNVSSIIGSGIVKGTKYDEKTGMLTIEFVAGEPTEVNLGALLDINDVSIDADSKNYLGVALDASASEEDGSQAKFSAKIGKMEEVKNADETSGTAAVTGLADALDVKNYVDKQVADNKVSSEGDVYVDASVQDNKVTVKSNVTELTATAGTAPIYDNNGTETTAKQDPTLIGTDKSLADSADIAAKVKTYVDGKVAIEEAVLQEAIKAAVRGLDATVYSVGTNNETFNAATDNVKVKVEEVDGKLTGIEVVTNDIASAKDLTTEIARAKSAETAIDSAIGLTNSTDDEARTYTNEGEYIGKHTTNTVASDIKALDTALKNVAISTSAIQYKVDGTTLEFFGITSKTVV